MNRRWTFALSLCTVSATLAAQDLPPGTTVTSASLSAIAQFDTDLDNNGGSFRWAGGIATGSVLYQVNKQFAAGLSLQYDFQQWHFSNPTGLGGIAPWRDINQPQVGANFIYTPTDDWTILVSPSVAWGYETGASTSDALTYGAVVVVSKDFSPTLSIGLGAAIYREIFRTRTYPFLAIEWQIDDHWKLANPFQAGPTGGAGLELSYAFGNEWEAGFGATYRSFVFRLKQDGPVPNGIGEQNYIPVFFRLSRTIGKQAQFDFYAAALANGSLKVKNPSGNDLYSSDYEVAPALGMSFRYRF
jgi:Domain of unknown function (DUF6268)